MIRPEDFHCKPMAGEYEMARRTKNKVGAWPNMRDDTMRAICDELIRAREKHPAKGNALRLLHSYSRELEQALDANTEAKRKGAVGPPATFIYALAATCAALVVRIMEEGSTGHAYAGNSSPPDFQLTSEGL